VSHWHSNKQRYSEFEQGIVVKEKSQARYTVEGETQDRGNYETKASFKRYKFLTNVQYFSVHYGFTSAEFLEPERSS
jgi:hypothetical protein